MNVLPAKFMFITLLLTGMLPVTRDIAQLNKGSLPLSQPYMDEVAQGAAADTTLDLYLLIGQSNMAGRGLVSEEYRNQGSTSVLMLDKNNSWVQARHPLHFDKPSVAGVGPGLSFGMMMAKHGKSRTIGLIPCAVGGTSIDAWKPGGYDEATKTHPYDDAIERLKAALRSGTLKGIIWLQGESDSSPEKAAAYLPKLQHLIQQLREIAGQPNVPFVAGELGRYKRQYQNINNELKKLPSLVPHTAVVSSKGFTDKGDNTHFDSKSADEYGLRFAKAMKRLQKKLKKNGENPAASRN